ncbi:hypothetical protein EVAR_99594_1 [Eumeta japonica]|uniref:Uncharacterized protein n=1 Tax=Eumeta variegata TaxID=151549 RepID=A0A4C1ZIM7_EUMVA|nr:hypothetical protein EVAR_99594_1 [Eumeta japonica]
MMTTLAAPDQHWTSMEILRAKPANPKQKETVGGPRPISERSVERQRGGTAAIMTKACACISEARSKEAAGRARPTGQEWNACDVGAARRHFFTMLNTSDHRSSRGPLKISGTVSRPHPACLHAAVSRSLLYSAPQNTQPSCFRSRSITLLVGVHTA